MAVKTRLVPGQRMSRILWLTALSAILGQLASLAIAAEDVEAQRIKGVKAAFILNIARFVNWPPGTIGNEAPHTLCFYQANPLGQAVESIRGKRISGHPLQLDTIDSLKGSGPCTVLFVSYPALPRLKAEMTGNLQGPLLTIADLTEEGAVTGVPHRGVMISMVRDGARISLEVDLQQARSAGLQVNSQLLNLARIVHKGGD